MTGNNNNNNPAQYTTPPTPACQTNARRISDYLSHTLSPTDTASLEQHLASCPYCTALLNSYSLLDQQIKTLPNPSASPRVRAAVMNAIAEAEADKRSLKPISMPMASRAPRLASSMAALAMLAAFAGALGLMFSGRGLLPPADTAFASPTVGVPSSITPAIDNPIAMGTQTLLPLASGTPLPQALLVQPVQASATDSSTKLVFTSVDSAGMTQTIASRPNVVKDAPVALSPDYTHAVYTVQDEKGARREVYDLATGKVNGSVTAANPLPGEPLNYDITNAAISPDNRYVAYGSYANEEQPLIVFDLVPGEPMLPHPGQQFPFTTAKQSPTFYLGWGINSLLYTYNGVTGDESHTLSINGYDLVDGRQAGSLSIPAGDVVQSMPQMSGDGKYIFFAVTNNPGAVPGSKPEWQLMKYDVLNHSLSNVAESNDQSFSGPVVEAPDGNSLLYIESGKQPGSLEIRRAGLHTPIDSPVADVKAPDGASSVAVSAMQVCGAIVFYQTVSSDGKGQQQTSLIAQPLNGGAAKTLPEQGQLIGCTASK